MAMVWLSCIPQLGDCYRNHTRDGEIHLKATRMMGHLSYRAFSAKVGKMLYCPPCWLSTNYLHQLDRFLSGLEFAFRTERCDTADSLGAVLLPDQHPTLLQFLTASISRKLPASFMIVTLGVQATREAWRNIHFGWTDSGWFLQWWQDFDFWLPNDWNEITIVSSIAGT